jgi:hypothetical protein
MKMTRNFDVKMNNVKSFLADYVEQNLTFHYLVKVQFFLENDLLTKKKNIKMNINFPQNMSLKRQ